MSNTLLSSKERIIQAKQVMINAYKIAQSANTYGEVSSKLTKPQRDLLSTILLGNHKTYRYILMTALTAKSADPAVNILSIQKSDTSIGAYDSRSIAHKVVVPFERQYLNEALGGSNEPYLNKPARFASLSKDNAVRSGSDQQKLYALVDTLPTFDSESAKIALQSAIFLLLKKKPLGDNTAKQRVDTTGLSLQSISNYLDQLTSDSLNGQTLPLACAILLKQFMSLLPGKSEVHLHKVNQAGSSSKEIEDIDVYHNKNILYALEAKNKYFTVQDVQHSIEKVANAGVASLLFIYSDNTTPSSETILKSKHIASQHGVYLTIQPYSSFSNVVFGLLPSYESSEFDDDLYDFATSANMTDEVFTKIKSLFS
jgi:hypothetical protein